MSNNLIRLKKRVYNHLEIIYPEQDNHYLTDKLLHIMALDEVCFTPLSHHNHWNE